MDPRHGQSPSRPGSAKAFAAGALWVATLAICTVVIGSAVAAGAVKVSQNASAVTDYVVGPQDVLTITSYDQADLSGKFTIETDGTFTYPMIGRFKAGGLTLRHVEDGLKKRLKDEGYFNNPQVT